jgi:uncharacterized protein with beta-barrel porin domain
MWDWTSLNLNADLSWAREFLQKSGKLASSPVTTGPSSAAVFQGIGRNVAMASVDVMWNLFEKYGIEFIYNFQWNSTYRTHDFTVNANFRF